jgi:hypothetical protein
VRCKCEFSVKTGLNEPRYQKAKPISVVYDTAMVGGKEFPSYIQGGKIPDKLKDCYILMKEWHSMNLVIFIKESLWN